MSDDTIKKLMGEIDCDNDGNISFSEFVQVMVRHSRQRDANGAIPSRGLPDACACITRSVSLRFARVASGVADYERAHDCASI